MINLFKNSKALLTVLTVGSVVTTASAAQALTLKVEVENLAPDGGVALTPVWVGFHDGSFDSYNGGLPSELGLERIAEDGNAMVISADFNANKTYVQDGASGVFDTTQVGTRVDGTVGPGAILPGDKVMSLFEVTPDVSNGWFSYVSMVLPSSDYYVANGNPTAWGLTDLFTGVASSISFDIGLPGTITDAGTEVNNFASSAGNGLFQDPPLPPGQDGPNQGAEQNGLNTNVGNPYGDFLSKPPGFDTNFASLNFNDTDLYPDGIGRITISVFEEPPVGQDPESVPESSTTVGLIAMAGLFLGARLRRCNHRLN